MKIGIVNLLNKLLELLRFKSKSGEKSQEIEEKKLTEFKTIVSKIVLILLIFCIAGAIFPNLGINGWFYDMFEKGWEYILGN